MKKGLAIPLGGMFALIICISVLAVLTYFDQPFRAAAELKGEVAISNLNELELIRKMVGESVKPIAQRAAYDLAEDGSGREYWTKTSPDMTYIKEKLAEQIETNLPTYSQGNYERTVEWDDPDITIVENTDTFTVIGETEFILTDTTIYSEARSAVPFNHEIASSYLKLAKVGRKILEDPTYRAILESADTPETKASQLLTNLHAQYAGLVFDITVSGNDLVIVIEDQTSLAPITQAEMTSLGKTTPFDTLKLKFKTGAFQGD